MAPSILCLLSSFMVRFEGFMNISNNLQGKKELVLIAMLNNKQLNTNIEEYHL